GWYRRPAGTSFSSSPATCRKNSGTCAREPDRSPKQNRSQNQRASRLGLALRPPEFLRRGPRAPRQRRRRHDEPSEIAHSPPPQLTSDRSPCGRNIGARAERKRAGSTPFRTSSESLAPVKRKPSGRCARRRFPKLAKPLPVSAPHPRP